MRTTKFKQHRNRLQQERLLSSAVMQWPEAKLPVIVRKPVIATRLFYQQLNLAQLLCAELSFCLGFREWLHALNRRCEAILLMLNNQIEQEDGRSIDDLLREEAEGLEGLLDQGCMSIKLDLPASHDWLADELEGLLERCREAVRSVGYDLYHVLLHAD